MEFTSILLHLTALLILMESFISWTMANDNFTLPSNCYKTCGDIQIEYPFGIGNGCSYAAGFNLTCAYDSNAPRLLLGDGTIQVKNFDMENNLVHIESPYATLNADAKFLNSTLIDLKNFPFSFGLRLAYSGRPSHSIGHNQLLVIGCNATATIVDVVTSGIIGACSIICSTTNTSTIEGGYYSSNGYCIIELHNVNSITWAIQLTRLNENENQYHMINNSTSNITAIVVDEDFTNVDGIQRFINHHNGIGMMASLAWHIDDHSTCKEAMKSIDTYACRSHKSECYDVLYEDAMYSNETIGYSCQCSLDYIGNPYLPNGCQLDQNFTSTPMKDCPTECGNVTISFPFGLKQGCYRDEGFALTCNKTSHPPTLLFRDQNILSKISLEEGQLEFDHLDFYDSYSDRHSHFAYSEMTMTTINWVVAYQSCNDAAKDMTTFACIHEHSLCLDVNDVNDTRDSHDIGYRCKCSDGYDGNPYLPDGCQDIDECNSSQNVCTGTCINTNGSYSCICPLGTYGDPYREACLPHKRISLLLIGSVGGFSGVIILLLCIMYLYVAHQRRKLKELRRKYFKYHGGHELEKMMDLEKTVNKFKIFGSKELEKATNNFDDKNIIGKGGNGVVYKGVLETQDVVAIKKPKIIKEDLKKQFGTETLILSNVNHVNIVKLLGCCLETEMPLLVYEFIPNGTLSHLIHENENRAPISLDTRLRLAYESADALDYLHSKASPQIIHGDVKPSNILLDVDNTAKVSDFGASKLIPKGEKQFATLLEFTVGYLDPECLMTYKLTSKSDVYSFGVVLLELFTGKKAISYEESKEGISLVSTFAMFEKQNNVIEILDNQVKLKSNMKFIQELTELVKQCLKPKGEERPTMREVAEKLSQMRTHMQQSIEVHQIAEETYSLLGELSNINHIDSYTTFSIQNRSTRWSNMQD